MNNDDAEAIRKATQNLSEVIQQIGAAAYQQQPEPQAEGQAPPSGEQAGPGDEDVVDGEFRNV
jgi:molecular chaperone DnaK